MFYVFLWCILWASGPEIKVIYLILSDGSLVSVDSPSNSASVFLAFFSHPGATISRVFLPALSWSRLFTWPTHVSLAFLYIYVILSTDSRSLMSSFLTWYLYRTGHPTSFSSCSIHIVSSCVLLYPCHHRSAG